VQFGEIKPGVEDIEDMIATTMTHLKDLLDRVFNTVEVLFHKAVVRSRQALGCGLIVCVCRGGGGVVCKRLLLTF
jgi:hypothetical protein